ncbi:hypothetical protein FNA46_07200 [Rhizobium straminoryzae]|uniref:Uncharacterized protein n=1 Tax=Rhizobium straminoryzae TaxID=1387186 RepID=A0A549TDD1_9HYPH|nr:hypothetical protein FNA46_07200 [Rhizobium straminoryzae]
MAVWTTGSARNTNMFWCWVKRRLLRQGRPATPHVKDMPDALRRDVLASPAGPPARLDDVWERIRTARLPPL